MPGMLANTYAGAASVPVHHSVQEVRAALVKEVADSKRDAMLYEVQWSQPYLYNERKKTLAGSASKKYKRAKSVSKDTNYTGLA